MPSAYQLQPDEWVVSKADVGAYHGLRPKVGLTQTELILTSRNIVVVSLTMSAKPKGVRYFPLEQVKVIDGRPQVFEAGAFRPNLLEVHFQNGQESFGFGSRNELHAWADNISKLLTRRSDEISVTTDISTNAVVSVGDHLKDTVDQVKDVFRLTSHRNRADTIPNRAARKCTSCSAPVSGIAGRVVRCEYCQSDQQL